MDGGPEVEVRMKVRMKVSMVTEILEMEEMLLGPNCPLDVGDHTSSW